MSAGTSFIFYCAGEGTPTVVLEAPATAMSAGMGVGAGGRCENDARRAATIAPDSAGANRAMRRFHAQNAPTELNALLVKAGGACAVRPCRGGARRHRCATLYASRYPDDTGRARHLINPPGAFDRRAGVDAVGRVRRGITVARAGRRPSRVAHPVVQRTGHSRAPAAGALRAFLNRPDHLDACSRRARAMGRHRRARARSCTAPERAADHAGWSRRTAIASRSWPDRRNADDVTRRYRCARRGKRQRRS